MAQIFDNARILIKRSTITGEVPTIPSIEDHTRNSWLASDIYIGEMFMNLPDQRIWFRSGTASIKEILFSGTNSTFLSLDDVPLTYVGSGLQGVRVNSTEDALEFFDIVDCKVALDTDPTVGYYLDSGYFGTASDGIYPLQSISDGGTGVLDLWSGNYMAGTISTIIQTTINIQGTTGSIQLNSGSGTFSSPTSGSYDSTKDSWIFSKDGGSYGVNSFTDGYKTYAGHFGNLIYDTDGTGDYIVITGDVTSYYNDSDSILLVNDTSDNEGLIVASSSYDAGLNRTYIWPTIDFVETDFILLINLTTATLDYSLAEGNFTIAFGKASHAEGFKTRALGDYSHAEGDGGIAEGISSHVEGNACGATGSYSHAEGSTSFAIGDYSHAEGSNTSAIGIAAHSQGAGTDAAGDFSFASGYGSRASGDYSAAFGRNSLANGNYSAVFGRQSTSNGEYSLALGKWSNGINPTEVSLSSGQIDTKTSQKGEVVMGCITTDTTPVVAKIDYTDTPQNYQITTNSSFLFTVSGVARSSTGSTAYFPKTSIAGVKDVSNTVTLDYSTTIDSVGILGLTVSCGVVGNEFELNCNGDSNIYHWTLHMEAVEINY